LSARCERHEWIKMRLRLAGSSLSQVARDLGVRPTTVTSVSQGFRRSRRIEGRIADVLSTAPAQLWPERYAAMQSDSAIEHSAKSTGGGHTTQKV
jgi:Ner family transcriptional regulator